VIFVDSNIPMYLVGAPHPNKDAAARVLTFDSDFDRLTDIARVKL
jgi:predicted nucleic acid-binding protein